MIKDLPTPTNWSHSAAVKGRQSYCGVTNLGCICYMISMLQQCYMVPQFRYLLLKAFVDHSKIEVKEWRNKKHMDNLVYQFQRLFGYLELSERDTVDGTGFCFAYKDHDGEPTKISVQCDCQEFLNIFFDRVETQLADTSQKYLI